MSPLWILNGKFNVKKDSPRQGGTATVYKGINIENGQPVAVKLFNNSNMKQELTTEAYQRELKSLDDLNSHENIAKVIDFGNDPESGHQFIIMEWLEDSLLEVINRNDVTCWNDFYIHYGKPILEALSFSHKRDIIHRDIKPANVLFTADGKLRIVDFGISKYKAYWGSNVTFLGWNSKPYAPPENDNFRYINTRDIYGFAALSLACIEGRELEEDENVVELLKNHTLDEGVVELLEQCLSYSPQDRVQSIEELIDSLDRFCITNKESNFTSGERCYLSLTTTATQQLQISIGLSDKTSLERHISRELNEACAVERKGIDKYVFLSVEHSYIVAIDDRSKSHLVILKAVRREPWILENARGRHYNPDIHYSIGKPPTSNAVREATYKLLDNFAEYEANLVERLEQAEEKKLIATWRAQLRLQLDLEIIARKEVEYNKFSVEDDQIVFHVGAGDWAGMLGEERLIRCNDRRSFSIIIDDISQDKLYGSLESIDEENIPSKGVLSLDTRLQAVSRVRQEEALDDVLFGRSYRADLRRLIFQPKNCVPHNLVTIDKYFQSDLDEAKKNVVSAVLGLKDFLVVNGPPGTGKTKVIAEMVLQFLLANPGAKILISSQTHNALDNAIERIREVKGDDANLGAVRIGRREDHRISPSVKDLLLDNLVTIWLKNIKNKSTQYLDEWSTKLGIDRLEVELGLSVRMLRHSLNDFEKLVDEREGLQSELKELESLISEMKSKEKIPEDLSLSLFNREKSIENLRDIDDSIVRSRRYFREAQKSLVEGFSDGKSLANLTADELIEWEEEFLAGTEERERCKNVIELLQDWFDRFGRTTDFNAAFLSDSSIVSATCIGIGLKAYRDVKFDLCIVDEASKATPTEALLPIVKSKKWVVVGDQAQLPPFVHEGATNKNLLSKHSLRESDLKNTLLDRLISNLPETSVMSLDTQYRMCSEIGNLVSQIFYNGNLMTGRGPSVGFDKYLAVTKPVTWYTTSNEKKRFETREGNSYVNRLEACYISDLIKRFNFAARTLKRTFSVCVLSFYSSQQNVLKSEVARISSECEFLEINCDTVDSFQGREADICIISVTRSNTHSTLGFVDDFNRINVAMSRGKEALVIVGDSEFCMGSGQGNPLESVLNYIQNTKADCALVEV